MALPPLGPGAVPAWLRPAARSLLGGVLPGTARVTAVRLGSLLLVATPAEPVEAVGRAWRAAAGPDAELLSLADGYVGYVDTAARFTAGAGEAHRSYYGPELAARLEAAVAAAAQAADAARAAPSPARRLSADRADGRVSNGPPRGAFSNGLAQRVRRRGQPARLGVEPAARAPPGGRPACRSASRCRGPS